VATIYYTQQGKACQQFTTDSTTGKALLTEATSLPVIGKYKNNWRQRRVEVYKHKSNPSLVLSVGYGFGEALGNIYVCEERLEAYRGRIENNDWRDYD
jgi:hypothetical protein